MNRHHGSRPRTTRSMLASATALGMFAAGALGFLAFQTAAHADASEVLGAKNLPTISVGYGDSVDFTAPSTGGVYIGYAGVNLSGLGVSVAIPRTSTISVGPLTNSGSNKVYWQAYCEVLSKTVKCTPTAGTYSMTVIVGDAPPPPDSSTPVSPGSSTPGDPGSTTPGTSPSGTASSAPGSTPSGTASSSPGSTPSKTPGGGGGITIGPVTVHPSNIDNVPLGFGPPVDPNAPTPSIPNPIGSGVGVVPTGGPASDKPSDRQSTQTLIELANTTPKPKSRPTSLAIVAIGLLAIVSSVYAYRRLGEQVQRPTH